VPVRLPATVGARQAGGETPLPWPFSRLPGSLAADPRLFWWSRRAVMATVAGVAAGWPAGWRAGVTVAGVAALADTLLRSRTSGVIPAAVWAGSAHRRTRRRLRRLAPSGYLSLHARRLPGTESVVDHLVIGPAGVFAVDSQRWDRRLPVRVTRGGQLFHGPFDQAARLQQVAWQAQQAGLLIGQAAGEAAIVMPAMAIYGPTIPWVVASISGVDVFGGRRVRRYLRRAASADRRRLSQEQVEAIHEAAARVLPPAR
jgi:hypothetical protein